MDTVASKVCSVPGCGREHAARGWCKGHWRRWRLYGNPEVDMRPVRGVCSIPSCGRKCYGHGLCAAHYARWRSHGDPGDAPIRDVKAPRRFLEDIVLKQESDDCLLWPHSAGSTGYGSIQIGDRAWRVNRLVCERRCGPPPTPNSQAAHSCGQKLCCNPKHLRWASPSENQMDKWAHGTMVAGERHPGSRLTPPVVREIRALRGVSQRALAKRFGVSKSTIGRAQRGEFWGHVPDEPQLGEVA